METISTTVNTLVLTVGMATAAVVINRNNWNEAGSSDGSRFPKPSVLPPGPLTRNTQDWQTWKEQSLSKFRTLGLSKILKDKERATENPGDDEAACFMLQNYVAGGSAPATLVGKGDDHDGCLAWDALVIECGGRGQRVLEAHRIRAELDGLHLGTRSNGQTRSIKFKECARRLQEIKEANSESARTEK